MKKWKIRYLIEGKKASDYFWSTVQVLDKKEEALAKCHYNIETRKALANRGEDHAYLKDYYRVIKRVEEVVFTEKEEAFK